MCYLIFETPCQGLQLSKIWLLLRIMWQSVHLQAKVLNVLGRCPSRQSYVFTHRSEYFPDIVVLDKL